MRVSPCVLVIVWDIGFLTSPDGLCSFAFFFFHELWYRVRVLERTLFFLTQSPFSSNAGCTKQGVMQSSLLRRIQQEPRLWWVPHVKESNYAMCFTTIFFCNDVCKRLFFYIWNWNSFLLLAPRPVEENEVSEDNWILSGYTGRKRVSGSGEWRTLITIADRVTPKYLGHRKHAYPLRFGIQPAMR